MPTTLVTTSTRLIISGGFIVSGALGAVLGRGGFIGRFGERKDLCRDVGRGLPFLITPIFLTTLSSRTHCQPSNSKLKRS